MYLQYMSFLHMNTTQMIEMEVEILPRVRQEATYST